MKKIIAIVAVLIIAIVLGIWVFKTKGKVPPPNAELQKQIDSIQKSRDSLMVYVKTLEEGQQKLLDSISTQLRISDSLKYMISESEKVLAESKVNLQKAQGKYDNFLTKFNAYVSHPIEKDTAELIKSLRKKTR